MEAEEPKKIKPKRTSSQRCSEWLHSTLVKPKKNERELRKKVGFYQDISINLGRTDSPVLCRTISEGSHFFKMLGVSLFRAL